MDFVLNDFKFQGYRVLDRKIDNSYKRLQNIRLAHVLNWRSIKLRTCSAVLQREGSLQERFRLEFSIQNCVTAGDGEAWTIRTVVCQFLFPRNRQILIKTHNCVIFVLSFISLFYAPANICPNFPLFSLLLCFHFIFSWQRDTPHDLLDYLVLIKCWIWAFYYLLNYIFMFHDEYKFKTNKRTSTQNTKLRLIAANILWFCYWKWKFLRWIFLLP